MYVDPEGLFPSYVNRGNTISFEKHYNQTEPKLAKAQRALAHKEHDGDYRSNNYEKQAKKVARIQAKVKHQREDFIRQIAVRLAREYDVISIESLDISAIKRSLKFGKSVSDNGWGMFIEQLERKCAEYGALLIRVDKWFPSTKTCSNCGYIHKEIELNDRTYICPKCGHVMDSDQQAAINIDAEGMRLFCEYFLPGKPPLPPKAWDKELKSIRIKSAKQLADPSAKVPSYADSLRKE